MNRITTHNDEPGPSLSAQEKAEGLSHLKAFMAEHPITEIGSVAVPILSPFAQVMGPLLFYTSVYRRQLTGVMCLIVLVFSGTGISFAAERSLPGDLLYPVKIKFNERVSAMVTLSAKGKAQLYAELATRRLEEAEKLSLEGKLSEEDKQMLEMHFVHHANEVDAEIKTLESQNDFEGAGHVSSSFEASLDKHKDIFTNFEDGTDFGKGLNSASVSAQIKKFKANKHTETVPDKINTKNESVIATTTTTFIHGATSSSIISTTTIVPAQIVASTSTGSSTSIEVEKKASSGDTSVQQNTTMVAPPTTELLHDSVNPKKPNLGL